MQRVIAILACGTAMLIAGEPWKDKKSDDWSEKDVDRILTNSPWAKSVILGGAAPVSGLGAAGGVFGATAVLASGPKVTVRWDSAGPSLEALHGSRYELLDRLPKWSNEYYVITAPGMPVLDSAAGERQFDIREFAETIIKSTSLKRKGKEVIAPARVEFVRIDDEVVPVFLFPRSAGITEADKDVVFETSAGSTTVKVKFSLKDMQYGGKLAL